MLGSLDLTIKKPPDLGSDEARFILEKGHLGIAFTWWCRNIRLEAEQKNTPENVFNGMKLNDESELKIVTDWEAI